VDGDAFRARWQEAIARLRARDAGALLADARVVRLPGNVPPWTDTGLAVERGDDLTLLAQGRVVVAEALGLHTGPRYALWAKVGDEGTIWRGTQETQTRPAPASGTLRLGLLQGEWGTRDGRLATPLEAYAGVTGAIDVVCLRWRGRAAEGLAALEALLPGDPLIAAERARLAHPVTRPPGWEYLWFLGEAEVFASGRAQVAGDATAHATIGACFRDEVAILRKPVELPLAPDTTLRWRWRVSQLPSEKAENDLLQHDYLSLALEFENGRDLTWYWSASLPVETGYACPIPTWTPRETHVVVRSGPVGLGDWQAEQRRVHDDYARYVGEPPRRIVAAWLIAVALFQHGSGAGEFAQIVLEGGGRRLEIL
jgi:hypothetical protein